MKIQVGNLRAHAVETTDVEDRFLSDYLVFRDPRAPFLPSVRAGGWDGVHRMYDALRRSFPAGLVPLLVRGAAKVGHVVEVEDLRERIEPVVCDLPGLRDYQTEAVAKGLQATRGIFWMPTASGKTRVFAALTKVIPHPWLILVDQKDLLNQAAKAVAEYTMEKVGRVGDGHFDVERVTVATFQGLNSALMRKQAAAKDLLEGARGLVLDECHVSAAAVLQRLMARTPNAYWRFGFSATPLQRGDRRNLLIVGATGAVIYKVAPQALIEQGVLARPTLRFVGVEAERLPADLTWAEAYSLGVVRSVERNALVVRVAQRAAKPALVFVKEIEHGRALLALLQRSGLHADFVWGTDSQAQRDEAVKRLVRGDFDVLVTSAIFNKGKDIPEVRSCVVAAGGKDAILAIQRLGRGMRIAAGKTEMELWDFSDTAHRWLKRHASRRWLTYEQAGYEVERVEIPAQLALVENSSGAA